MKKILVVALAVCMGGAALAKEKVVIVPAHPDDLISTIGFCLLARNTFEVHVIDFTHGERGLGLEGFTNGVAKATRIKEEESVCAPSSRGGNVSRHAYGHAGFRAGRGGQVALSRTPGTTQHLSGTSAHVAWQA